MISSAIEAQPIQSDLHARAIVYLSRSTIRPMVREVLVEKGIGDILVPKSLDECRSLLSVYPDSLFIFDWDHGQKDIAELFKNEGDRFSAVTRPSYLICQTAESEVVASAYEYCVSVVHSGEISRKIIAKHLDTILGAGGRYGEVRSELVKAKGLRSVGDWEKSMEIFRNLSKDFPLDTRFKVDLASDLINSDQWDQAFEVLEEVLMTDDLNLRGLHLIARCYMHRGDHKNALKFLESAQSFNPYQPQRLVDLGRCLMFVDEIGKARKAFDRALELDCEFRDAIVYKGQCQLMDGQINDALEMLQDISGPKELASIFNNAAILTIRHQRFQEGIKLYETAIATLGDKPRPRTLAKLVFNLGLGYVRWQKSDEALECFEKAHRVDPNFNKARHNAKITALRLERTPHLVNESGFGSSHLTDDDVAFETGI